MKYYAVKKGVVPGVYTNWPDCEKNVKGISDAIFKSFPTLEEAEEFVNDDSEPVRQTAAEKGMAFETHLKDMTDKDHATAYIDGSHDSDANAVSYGVIVYSDNGLYENCRKLEDPEYVKSGATAGKVKAAMDAMQYCIDNGIKTLNLYYDYEGIASWCTGKWRTKNGITREYREFYVNTVEPALTVNFHRIKSGLDETGKKQANALARSVF